MSKPSRGSRRAPLSSRPLAVLLASLLLTISCSEREGATGPAGTASAAAPSDVETAARAAAPEARPAGKPEPASAPRNPNERPLPAFEGTTLSGGRLALRDLLGTRVVLFFFNPEVPESAAVAAGVEAIAARAGEHNFRVVGIGVGSQPATLSSFVAEQALSFPVIDDSAGTITSLLRLRAPIAILGMDAEGYMSFGMGHFPAGAGLEEMVVQDLTSQLRLETPGSTGDGALYAWPDAPELGVVAMSDGKLLETADLRGRAAIVIFFLHTCPHCHKALEAIEGILDSIPAEQRPRLVAISVQNAPSAIRASLAELGLDFFDPYLDPSGKASERWGITGGVPVVHVLDAQGRIRHRGQGWSEQRDPGLLRMTVAAAAGARVPMLLDPKGYSGNDVCGTCHQQEYATWRYTSHATAFDTLVTHAADRRTDCVGCHVVGFGEPGGYDFRRQPAHLENVGCESCHGRGGPHLSPGFVAGNDYRTVCSTCHNPTHSLGFDYATFHPRVSHERIASLSNAERAALLASGGPNRELLPTTADYVGSEACRSCHTAEFETWQASPHGHAVATLEAKGKASDADCLRCHTTAYDKPGGFPAGGDVAAHPDLARVGCESCHGPGGDHVGETTRKVGTILSLGDKCDSCVILKVCGSCHDAENDPGFEFEVEARIEAQRHGTIEAAATRAARDGS